MRNSQKKNGDESFQLSAVLSSESESQSGKIVGTDGNGTEKLWVLTEMELKNCGY